MDLSRYQHQETIVIAASPDALYEMVADVTRMGEWSPVCTGCEWDDDEQLWFTGTNVLPEYTWQTKCMVEVAERGEAFTFVNHGPSRDVAIVRWGFTFTATDDGTEVVQSWEVLDAYADMMERLAPGMDAVARLDGMVPGTQAGMAQTLANLKESAEA